MDRLLPPIKFVTPPAPEQGRELALELIEKVSPPLGGLAIAKMVVEQEGWRIGYFQTGPNGSNLRALLVPLLKGGFTISINERMLPHDAEKRLRQEAFLVGHEIAHSFFYHLPSDQVPRRIGGRWASHEEELFCDEFGLPFSEY